MIQSQRHLFDIPEDIAYLNCAYYSPLLKESTRRLHLGVDSKSHPWERIAADFFDDAETVRQLCADLFGGGPDGFAVIPAASYGINTAARVIEPRLTKEDRILVMEEDFPSVVLPMKRIAQETGAKLITVKKPEHGDWTQAIKEGLDNNVKVVAISSCHWTNGAYIDLLEIRKACDKTDSILIVDATQMLGAMPFSIDRVRPDFLIAAGYKWLLGPYGFTLFYVAEKWRNERPLEEAWQAREKAEDFAGLVKYSDVYMAGTRRFDGGEKCTPTILPGAIAALEQIKKWGIEEIANSLSLINDNIVSHLLKLGFKLPDQKQRCPHMFGATIPAHYKGNLVNELKEIKIYVSQRGNAIRFSPHLYINDNDIDRLLLTLKEVMGK